MKLLWKKKKKEKTILHARFPFFLFSLDRIHSKIVFQLERRITLTRIIDNKLIQLLSSSSKEKIALLWMMIQNFKIPPRGQKKRGRRSNWSATGHDPEGTYADSFCRRVLPFTKKREEEEEEEAEGARGVDYPRADSRLGNYSFSRRRGRVSNSKAAATFLICLFHSVGCWPVGSAPNGPVLLHKSFPLQEGRASSKCRGYIRCIYQ